MRIAIYVLTALVVAAALFLFDDVDTGLPVVNLILWPTVVLAGMLLALRAHSRRSRRVPHRRHMTPVVHEMTRRLPDRPAPLWITRR